VALWDLATGSAAGTLTAGASVLGVDLSRDDALVAAASIDGGVHVWDAKTGIVRWEARLAKGEIPTGVAFLPDGARLAVSQASGQVSLWDVKGGTREALLDGGVAAMGLAVSPRGEEIAVAHGNDAHARLLALPDGPLRVLDPPLGRQLSATFTDDGRLVSVGDLGLTLVDVGSGAMLRTIRTPEPAMAAASSGDVVVTSALSSIAGFSLTSGRPLWQLGMALPNPPVRYDGRAWRSLDDGAVVSLPASKWRAAVETRARLGQASSDGDTLCFFTDDNELELWDRRTDERVLHVPSSAFSVFAVSDACITAGLPDQSPGAPIQLYPRAGEPVPLSGVDNWYDASAREIYLQRGDRVEVRDTRGALLADYPAHGGFAAGTRTADWLAVGYRNGRLEVTRLDAAPGAEPMVMKPASASLLGLLAKGPGHTLLGGYQSGLLAAWDLATGEVIATEKAVGVLVHLYVHASRAYGVTDTGHSVVLDLADFERPYCDVLGDVWRATPVEWESGAAVSKPRPADHPCAR
ncbi:MAG: PQQ-binding-like beta-propeller repeat protein, partial [Polyangiaceae bacterium]|nr:PQQ-binding-like beta-propeller repeat protein [Polyangiaceae bacterium]